MIEKADYKASGDFCDMCETEIKHGRNVYFEKTSVEYDDCDVFCYKCKLAEKEQKKSIGSNLTRLIMNNLKQHITALKQACYTALAEKKDTQAELLRGVILTAERSLADKLTLKLHIKRLKNTRDSAKGHDNMINYLDWMIGEAEKVND